ncbi:MAG: hypothetical protein ACREP6_05100, partial [Candidatus Binataceae bacterium]
GGEIADGVINGIAQINPDHISGRSFCEHEPAADAAPAGSAIRSAIAAVTIVSRETWPVALRCPFELDSLCFLKARFIVSPHF